MSFSTLPLSYCTNVHPGRNVEEVIDGIGRYTAAARRELGERIAAGLWLSASTVRELVAESAQVERLAETLREGELVCYTLNAFPYGDFHSERVKENVYLPDWTERERLEYTLECARILCQLMPTGVEGSLSTVPLGFKGFAAGNEMEKGKRGRGERLDPPVPSSPPSPLPGSPGGSRRSARRALKVSDRVAARKPLGSLAAITFDGQQNIGMPLSISAPPSPTVARSRSAPTAELARMPSSPRTRR